MEVGDAVFISPLLSLAFAGRWGTVADIVPTDLAPFKVQLREDGKKFQFSRIELVTEQTYYEFVSQHSHALSADRTLVKIKLPRNIHHIETDGGVYPIHQLLPITRCRSCNCDTTGVLAEFCEDCEYPLPSELK
jgi:hypothetical protein